MCTSFCGYLVQVSSVLLFASLLCVTCQDPEEQAISDLISSGKFTGVNIVKYSRNKREVIANAVKINTKLSPDDLENFDIVIRFTAPKPLDYVNFWRNSDDGKGRMIRKLEGCTVLSDQYYLNKTKISIDVACSEAMAGMVEIVAWDIKDILELTKLTNLSVGVERIAIQLGHKTLVYTVVFFKAF